MARKTEEMFSDVLTHHIDRGRIRTTQLLQAIMASGSLKDALQSAKAAGYDCSPHHPASRRNQFAAGKREELALLAVAEWGMRTVERFMRLLDDNRPRLDHDLRGRYGAHGIELTGCFGWRSFELLESFARSSMAEPGTESGFFRLLGVKPGKANGQGLLVTPQVQIALRRHFEAAHSVRTTDVAVDSMSCFLSSLAAQVASCMRRRLEGR